MLYILNMIAFIIWCIYAIKKSKMNWHTIIAIYTLAVLLIDIPEIIFYRILERYTFVVKFLSDPFKDGQLGIILSDGIILPAILIVFTYYLTPRNTWRCIASFTGLHICLEVIYLKLGYLKYFNWSILYSTIAYFTGFTVFAYFALRFKCYRSYVPFWIRLSSFSYPASSWWGSLFSGTLINLYEFKLGIFENPQTDDRIADLALTWSIVLLHVAIISHISHKRRRICYLIIPSSITLLCIWLNSKGVLLYHNWNSFFMLLRWFVPFILIYLYDNWEKEYDVECKST